jgi:hypothetical protein
MTNASERRALLADVPADSWLAQALGERQAQHRRA